MHFLINFPIVGNSKKTEGSVAKGKKKAHQSAEVADAGATARGSIAITRNGLEAANGVHTRPLRQRDASRAEAAEVKSSLEALPSDVRSSEGMLSYRPACPDI